MKKYFFNLTSFDDCSIGTTTSINLPLLSCREEGDYDEKDIEELMSIFKNHFSQRKIDRNKWHHITEIEHELKLKFQQTKL